MRAGKVIGPLLTTVSVVVVCLEWLEPANNRMRPEQLAAVAEAIDQRTPMSVDELTTVVSVTSNKLDLVFHCVLVKTLRADIDIPSFTDIMQEAALMNAKTREDYRKLLQSGVTIVMEYKDREGSPVAMIRVPPSDNKE